MLSMKNRSNLIFTVTTVVMIILLSFSTVGIQLGIDAAFPRSRRSEDLKYLPSGNFLKGAFLSFDEVFADLLWIKTLGYFGEHAQGDQNYQWLSRLLDITTTLDPYFQDPYEFGGVILSWELGDIDAGISILKKGMERVPRHHPRYWYLPFYIAFNYMYYKGDYKIAGEYLEIAASFPQRPAYLPLLVARLYSNTEDPGLALPFLEEMLAKTSSPEFREKLENRIKDVLIKQHVLLLSKACNQFQESTGRSLEHLGDLTTSGLLREIPREPYGGKYEIIDHCTVRSTSNSDDMKLHIDSKKKQPLILFQEQK